MRCTFRITKLKPKSFVADHFIGFRMSLWLLGTNSGGAQGSRIPDQREVLKQHGHPNKLTRPQVLQYQWLKVKE